MGRIIIKLKGWYFIWSTVVDAPITYKMTIDEITDYIRFQNGEEGVRLLPERLKRVEEKGTSSYVYKSVEAVIRCNRSGKNESNLSLENFISIYIDETMEEF